ncbi:MAG: hypothetical protein AAF215_29865 [Cyanobacteria bacterium P01_A01_bin.123]
MRYGEPDCLCAEHPSDTRCIKQSDQRYKKSQNQRFPAIATALEKGVAIVIDAP